MPRTFTLETPVEAIQGCEEAGGQRSRRDTAAVDANDGRAWGTQGQVGVGGVFRAYGGRRILARGWRDGAGRAPGSRRRARDRRWRCTAASLRTRTALRRG